MRYIFLSEGQTLISNYLKLYNIYIILIPSYYSNYQNTIAREERMTDRRNLHARPSIRETSGDGESPVLFCVKQLF